MSKDFTSTHFVTRTVSAGYDAEHEPVYVTKTLEFGTDKGRAVATYDSICAAFMVECVNNPNLNFTRVMLTQSIERVGVVVIEEETFYVSQ